MATFLDKIIDLRCTACCSHRCNTSLRTRLQFLQHGGFVFILFCCADAFCQGFLLEFNRSATAIPGSSPAVPPGGIPFPDPELLQSQFWRLPRPKQHSEMIHFWVNSAMFNTQGVSSIMHLKWLHVYQIILFSLEKNGSFQNEMLCIWWTSTFYVS